MANVTDPRLIAALNAASGTGGATGLPAGVPMLPDDSGAPTQAPPGMKPTEFEKYVQEAIPLRDDMVAAGYDPAYAAADAASRIRESGGNPQQVQIGKGISQGRQGRGEYQLDVFRRGLFKQIMGKDITRATKDEQAAYSAFENLTTEHKKYERVVAAGPDPAELGRRFSLQLEGPKKGAAEAGVRAAIAQAVSRIPIRSAPAPAANTTANPVRSPMNNTPRPIPFFAPGPIPKSLVFPRDVPITP